MQLADINTSASRDTVSDIAGSSFHTMVVGHVRQMSSTRSEPNNNVSALPQNARLPNAPSTRARFPSYSATPNQGTKPRTSTGRSYTSSQTVGSAGPLPAPPSQSGPQNRFHEDPPPYEPRSHKENDAENSYDRNGFPLSSTPRGLAETPPSPRLQPQNRSVLSFTGSGAPSPSRIKVRDLSHIQSFASEEVLARSHHGSGYSIKGRQEGGQQYEISSMPVTDIIEMVAGLLTKITTNNDRQHEHLHRSIPPPEGTTGLTQQATSVLAFHGKNVPSITILSYLSRIHKYCPTTYEVFLSLVVYFDRMTETVNNGALQDYHGGKQQTDDKERPSSARSNGAHSITDPLALSIDEEDLVDSDDEEPSPSLPSSLPSDRDAFNLSQFFIVDSFNIHRLVIAGVTCASKFFSDVFYTNSRYAKVGARPCTPCILADILRIGRWAPPHRVKSPGVTIPPAE